MKKLRTIQSWQKIILLIFFVDQSWPKLQYRFYPDLAADLWADTRVVLSWSVVGRFTESVIQLGLAWVRDDSARPGWNVRGRQAVADRGAVLLCVFSEYIYSLLYSHHTDFIWFQRCNTASAQSSISCCMSANVLLTESINMEVSKEWLLLSLSPQYYWTSGPDDLGHMTWGGMQC